jgi:DNA-directed RNA polymerase subunit beta'
MLHATAGSLAVNAVLPEAMRDYNRVLDKKGIQKLLEEVAHKHPEKYRQIAHDLSRVGYHTAYMTGGQSFGLKHMRVSLAARQHQQQIKTKINQIYTDSKLSDEQKEHAVVEELLNASKPMEDAILKESIAEGNPLGMQVLSGARGNAMNLRSLRGGDLLYVDHHDKPLPIPILNSFSQGLTPAEYFAGSFGARKGVTDVKFATQDAGFFCLAQGTMVRMANNSAKAIQDIQVGDVVLGANKQGGTFPVAVSAVFINGQKEVYTFSFAPQSDRNRSITVKATLNHKALSRPNSDEDYDKYTLGSIGQSGQVYNVFGVEAAPLSAQQAHYAGVRQTLRKNAFEPYPPPGSTAVPTVDHNYVFLGRQKTGLLPTYDIEVNSTDHLFVLDNGMVVSNSKQLNQIGHRLVVTSKDHDKQPDYIQGLPVDVEDPDNEGSLLAHDAGGYKRNTVLTPKVISDLRSKGIKRMLVRSPIAGGPSDGGVFANDLGIREKGTLPPIGDYVGVAAAQALSEPLSQAQLSSKHSGGVAGAAKGVSGFKLVNQLVQVPKHFKGGASHSQVDGRIQEVRPAPQGGNYVVINGQQHYVGTGYGVTVKPGDIVEAGDVLSEGIPNPAEIVKHKGIGEGRRYFSEVFRKAYQDSGITAHRRNIELMSRGLIDHVRLSDEMDDYVPGDTVPYSRLEHFYQPRSGYDVTEPKRAEGMYLERPVLHYSIGTKVRPSVIKHMNEFGVQSVVTHRDPPPFESEMIRGMENLAHDPDWMTRFLGSYLQKNLLKGVHRGDVSDMGGTSYVPALAAAEGFGREGKTVGYKVQQPSRSILKPLVDPPPNPTIASP